MCPIAFSRQNGLSKARYRDDLEKSKSCLDCASNDNKRRIFSSSKDVFKNDDTTMQDLYNSLTLWADISNNIEVKNTSICTNKFELLNNCILACPQKSGDHYDRIIYYDLETEEVIHNQKLKVKFKEYAENDKVTVLKNRNSLYVYLKESNQRFVLHYSKPIISWKLYENGLYFQSDKLHFYAVIERNNKQKMERVDFVYFCKNVKGFCKNDNKVNTLSAWDKESLEIDDVYQYGRVKITTKSPAKIEISFNNGDNVLEDCKLVNRKLSLVLNKDVKCCDTLEQADVIDTVHGHKIIMLYSGRIFLIKGKQNG